MLRNRGRSIALWVSFALLGTVLSFALWRQIDRRATSLPMVETGATPLSAQLPAIPMPEEALLGASPAAFRFYRLQGWSSAWSRGYHPTRPAEQLVASLGRAGEHGLDPATYEAGALSRELAAIAVLGGAEHEQLVALDLRLTEAALTYIRHLAIGSQDLPDLGLAWYLQANTLPGNEATGARWLVAALRTANLRRQPLGVTLATLAPQHDDYRRLRVLLARYRAIAADGGWPKIPNGPQMEPGEPGDRERLEALVERLRIEGDLPASVHAGEGGPAEHVDDAHIYDAHIAAAVERFQARNGLAIDGTVGQRTLAALNVSASHRAAQIAANLERWRQVAPLPQRRHLRVNIAAFELEAHAPPELVWRMPVVVGKEDWATPVFRDLMTYVEVNPTWHVPSSIASDEILPAVREDRGYLDKQNFEVLLVQKNNRQVRSVDGDDFDWGDFDSDEFELVFRQRPGPGNALGRIKFMFPNQHSIYLHDTPAKSGFERVDRALSHGCVRVSDPLRLADFVFASSPEVSRERIEGLIAKGKHHRLSLKEEIPVYILYWTAFERDGQAHFRRDLYAFDALQIAAWESPAQMPDHAELVTSGP